MKVQIIINADVKDKFKDRVKNFSPSGVCDLIVELIEKDFEEFKNYLLDFKVIE